VIAEEEGEEEVEGLEGEVEVEVDHHLEEEVHLDHLHKERKLSLINLSTQIHPFTTHLSRCLRLLFVLLLHY